MSRFIYIFIILGLFTLPFTALAQQDQATPNYQTGSQEFTLSGSGSSDNDFDTTNLEFDIGYGYFFDENWEGIIRQNIRVVDQPGNNAYNGATRLGIDYNFDLQNLRPFLGGTIGYMYGDGVKESFIAGPEGGLKIFLNNSTFVIAAVGYDFIFENANKAKDAFSDGFFNYRLGLGYKW